jgi:RHS repeat-associated protein
MRYEYDQRGQAVKIFDGLDNASNYTYDYERKLKTIQDKRGNTTSFEYDELDRPILQRNPLGQTSSAKYDSLSKVTESTDELGRRTNYNYDAVNRMTNIAYADAQVGYTYDTLNRITQISDSQGGTLNWAYDAIGQVQSETTANGIVSYTYNDAQQRISMTALNRPSVNYGYDTAGRLANITQGSDTFGYNYDSISRMTSLTRPNGVNTNYEYDQVNRLKRMTHGTIEDFKYEYNSDDEISSINSLNSATQLPTDKNSSGANSANRITQFGDSTFSFDDKGQTTTNTTASGTSMYTWDIRGRLKTVAMPNGETVNYNYDALGRRTSRTSSNQTTNFVYDGADVVQDKQGSNNVNYLNGLGIDDKLKVDNKYFLKDHLGSTIGLTNTSGNLVESQKYEAFGKASGSLSTRYGFTGREYDADTKLNYYRARWYDAEQGRFLSSDPIGFNAGENFYSYVGNSPLNFTDPFGLQPMNLSETETRRRLEQCKAMRELLRREAAEGSGPAAMMSSVTFNRGNNDGGTGLTPLNNRQNGNILVNGKEFDLDWYIDSHAVTGQFSRVLGPSAYVVGKMLWVRKNIYTGEPQTHYLPYEDPGELEAAIALSHGKGFKDIFNDDWFKEYCPCEQ